MFICASALSVQSYEYVAPSNSEGWIYSTLGWGERIVNVASEVSQGGAMLSKSSDAAFQGCEYTKKAALTKMSMLSKVFQTSEARRESKPRPLAPMRRLMIKAPSVKEPHGRNYAGFRWVMIPMMGDISAHMHFAARLQLLTTG